jgi:two-component system OmpR family sensor kinase
VSSNERRDARRSWSVRSRLLVGLLLVTALGMSAGGAITFLVQRDRILAGVDVSLATRVAEARRVLLGAANSKPTSPGSSAASPEAFTSANDAVQAVVGRVLPDSHEDTLGIVDGKAKFVPGVPTEFQLANIRGFVVHAVTVTRTGETKIGSTVSKWGTIRYIAAPITVAGSTDTAVFVAAVDLSSELGDLSSAFVTYWEVEAITLLLIAALGWFISGRLLRPIRNLRLAAARITADSRSERIPVRGRDDLSQLTVTVNDMLDRLDESFTAQRHLLDDVRHELNTPITIVLGHLELVNPYDPDDVIATRALAVDELDRVAALVQDLAELAESERADLSLQRTAIEELTQQVFDKVRVLPSHDWSLQEKADVTVEIDRERITQAWLQLADNAAKYSPAGSSIEIGSTLMPDGVRLWVADHGPGVPPESRARIFERFGRVESHRGIAGSGLGLSIVSAIAAAHGGTIELTSSTEETRFSLVLPIDEEGMK